MALWVTGAVNLVTRAFNVGGRARSVSVVGIFQQLMSGRTADQMECSLVLAAKFDGCDFAQVALGQKHGGVGPLLEKREKWGTPVHIIQKRTGTPVRIIQR
jgi:hypothetical protein